MIIDSESNLKKNSELAISLAKQESNVGNIDPIVAQKREFIVCRITQLKNEIGRTKVSIKKHNFIIYYYIKLWFYNYNIVNLLYNK